ncbi:MAG TPA: hypothetical protein VIK27_06035 [Candidatus Aquilonibacter sp.]
MILTLAASSACGEQQPTSEITADKAIRFIYAGDVHNTRQLFTADVRRTITPGSVNQLSSLMKAFGNYLGVTQIAAMSDRRYDLEAKFAHGSMLVQLRLEPAGKVAALHIIPNVPHIDLKTHT